MLILGSTCLPSLQPVVGQLAFIKNGSDEPSRHLCGHRGSRGVRKAERGDSRGSWAPQPFGRPSGIVFLGLGLSLCLVPRGTGIIFLNVSRGLKSSSYFSVWQIVCSLIPPRNQESQKLKPERLGFLSEEGPQQQMPVEPGKSSQEVEVWMEGTWPWAFSAGVGSEGRNSPG